jgi:hypothetical protein
VAIILLGIGERKLAKNAVIAGFRLALFIFYSTIPCHVPDVENATLAECLTGLEMELPAALSTGATCLFRRDGRILRYTQRVVQNTGQRIQ